MSVEKTVATLQKLYDKRSALDKQIVEAEKKLVEASNTVSKVVSQVKAVRGRKPAAKAAVKKALKN